jgi:hypothetical protein
VIALNGIERHEKDDSRVFGSDYHLVERLTPEQCAETLDGICNRIAEKPRQAHWSPNHHLTSAIHRLLAKAIQSPAIAPPRFWSWVRFVDALASYSSEPKDTVKEFLEANTTFRREVQRIALADGRVEGGPWIAIVHDLPRANLGLAMTHSDATAYLDELAAKSSLSDADIVLWTELVRSLGRPEHYPEGAARAITRATERHQQLAARWSDLTRPPARDWEKEEQRRQASYRRARKAKFARHRANFEKVKSDIESGKAFSALHNLALGYLGRFNDLESDAAPIDRISTWVGEDIAATAVRGFVASLSRNDLPTVEKIIEARTEGKRWNTEDVMMCGVAELVRAGQPLKAVSEEVAKAVLAIWWDMPEFNSTRLGEDMQNQLEARVLHNDEVTETFLAAVLESPIKAGKESISGLYRLPRDPRFKRIAVSLAFRWLQTYPEAKESVQRELMKICLHEGPVQTLPDLIRHRLSDPSKLGPIANRMWVAAAFLLELPDLQDVISKLADSDKSLLWSIMDLMRPDTFESRTFPFTTRHREFIVQKFAPQWPVAEHPNSTWSGENNPWDATSFMNSCIDGIGAIPTSDASDALDRLSERASNHTYRERIKHVRAQQRRLRRDKEYVPPSFEQVRATLTGAVPATIDDLKALMMDTLELVQDYTRNADTDGWEAYWSGNQPKVENTCRDRVLDALRPRVDKQIDIVPETLMPEKNRVDILALHAGMGLPIEVKGQWHADVWDASTTQLDDKYGRDWRADGRGIYLVLWFGAAHGKNLPQHPEGLSAPSSPEELQTMLIDRLNPNERSRIDVFVLDVSKPVSKKSLV